jgi:hypothetical protein
MTFARARTILVLIFIFFFTFNNLLIVIPFVKNSYGSESLINIMTRILVVYSVHVAVILGGIFGQKNSPRDLTSKDSFWIAFIVALLWNILLTWRCIVFTFIETDTTDEDLIKYIDTVAPASSFFVSGALTYFFTDQN